MGSKTALALGLEIWYIGGSVRFLGLGLALGEPAAKLCRIGRSNRVCTIHAGFQRSNVAGRWALGPACGPKTGERYSLADDVSVGHLIPLNPSYLYNFGV